MADSDHVPLDENDFRRERMMLSPSVFSWEEGEPDEWPPHTDKIDNGCGSFEVSWLRCEDEVFAVYGSVDALVLVAEVEAPVVVEVAVIPISA